MRCKIKIRGITYILPSFCFFIVLPHALRAPLIFYHVLSLVDVFIRFIGIVDKDHRGVGLTVDLIVENGRSVRILSRGKGKAWHGTIQRRHPKDQGPSRRQLRLRFLVHHLSTSLYVRGCGSFCIRGWCSERDVGFGCSVLNVFGW